MKILITGAGGFVGKRLTAALATQGHDVVALIRSQPAEADRKYFANRHIQVLTVDFETLNPEGLPTDIEAIVSLAQSSHFREFPGKALEVFEVNVVANLKLLDWAVRNGVHRVVHASSGGIYGGTQDGAALHESELFPLNSPLGFYLGSKLCSEIVFSNYRQYFDVAVMLRPFFIYGPGQRADMFVARIINSVRERRAITLQGEDGLRVNPIHVDDVLQAFIKSLELRGHHIINVAGADTVTLRQLGDAVGEMVGLPPVYSTVDGEPVDHVADISVAKDILGLAPRPFVQGLADTIASM